MVVAAQATGKQTYMDAARYMMDSLNKHARVEGGFASIRSVLSMEQVCGALKHCRPSLGNVCTLSVDSNKFISAASAWPNQMLRKCSFQDGLSNPE